MTASLQEACEQLDALLSSSEGPAAFEAKVAEGGFKMFASLATMCKDVGLVQRCLERLASRAPDPAAEAALLVEGRSLIYGEDCPRETPLAFAAMTGNLPAVNFFLAQPGVGADYIPPNGLAALGVAAAVSGFCLGSKGRSKGISTRSAQTITFILPDGPRHPTIDGGKTALQLATVLGRVAVVEALLADARTDPSIKTALQLATARGRVAVVKALLADPRTDPNITIDGGKTALQLATELGHVGVVKALLADPRTDLSIPVYGMPLLESAVQLASLPCLEALLGDARIIATGPVAPDHPQLTCLHDVVYRQNERLAVFRLLLKEAARGRFSVEAVDAFGYTPLARCFQGDWVEGVRVLINEGGANPLRRVQPGVRDLVDVLVACIRKGLNRHHPRMTLSNLPLQHITPGRNLPDARGTTRRAGIPQVPDARDAPGPAGGRRLGRGRRQWCHGLLLCLLVRPRLLRPVRINIVLGTGD